MTTVIMQPTYLPWIGYFDLIDQADNFVFLDNVQFKKQSWQQRNRLRTANGIEWFTIPVLIKGRFGQTINEVVINTNQFPEKQIKTLRQNYSSCHYFDDYWPALEATFLDSAVHKSLAKLNISIIQLVSNYLGLNTNFLMSSEFATDKKRSERLVHILSNLKSTHYLSPMGSVEYLVEDYKYFDMAGITISFQSFTSPEYEQKYQPYIPGASAIDMLFNIGAEKSLELMRGSRGKSRTFEDVTIEISGR